MDKITFKMSPENRQNAVMELLIENHALLLVLLDHLARGLSIESGTPFNDVLIELNEKYQNIRGEVGIETVARWGTPDVKLPPTK